MDAIELRNIIWDLVRSICENMEKTMRPIAADHNLTIIQLRMLMDIARDKEESIGNLSRVMCMAVGNTSAMCKKLEKEGYILRTRDKNDERIVKVSLTDKGNVIIDDIISVIAAKYTPIVEKEEASSIEAIIAGLVSLNDILNKINQ